jgi:hypothetical protein
MYWQPLPASKIRNRLQISAVGGELLAQFPRQRGPQILATLNATAGQHPVRVLPGACPLDSQQLAIWGDQQSTDAIGHWPPLAVRLPLR